VIQQDIYIITTRPEHFKEIGWDKFMDCQDALASLEFISEIQFDLETTGLGSFRKERINSAQIGLPGRQLIFDIEGGIPMSILKRPLEEKLLLFQNALYDLPYLYNQNIFPALVYDTFVAESVMTMGIDLPAGSRGLENLALKYLNVALDKSLQKDISGGIDTVEKIIYAGVDVMYLEAIREQQLVLANKYGVQRRVEMENKFVLVLAYVEFCGAYIDMEYLYEHVRDSEAEEWAMYRKMQEVHGKINWNSPKQAAVILKEHGIEEYNEDTGNPMTGEEVLAKHLDKPIAVDFLRYKQYSKLVSVYGRRWFGYVQDDGRIHTRFKQMVTTGRMACGATGKVKYKPWAASYETKSPFPNFQNMPAEAMRGIIVSEKGWKLIQSDFSSQESVILADQSGDPTMRRFFEEGEGDIYMFIAKHMHEELRDLPYAEIKSKHKDIRQKYKSVALLIPYGGDWFTIAADLNIPPEEAKPLYDAYFKTFNTLPEYFKKCYQYSRDHGYTPNDPVFGGKTFYKHGKAYKEKNRDKSYKARYYKERDLNSAWYLKEKEDAKWYFDMDNKLRRESVNYRIQGTGAVQMKLAGIYFYSYIQKNKLHDKIKIVNIIHDEYLVECREKIAETTSTILQQCMERAGNECLKHLKIKAEPQIVTRWSK
jgi:DNA polymerase-1